MNSNPIITTVIPTYRRPHLLRRAILSVLAQTYPHISVLVTDNASGDETAQVVNEIQKYDKRVKYHCHYANIGSYNNFNFGLNAVETEFFSLLSDDDFLVPDFYEKTAAMIKQFPDAGFYCMPTIVIDTDGKIISPPIQVNETRLYLPEDGLLGLVNGELPNTWTGIVFRKQVIEEIGVVDINAGPFADVGLVWRAGARFPFAVAPGIAAVLMAHKQSTSGTVEPISAVWPQWWKSMVDGAIAHEKVSATVRNQVTKFKGPDFKKIAFLQVMQYLADGRTDLAARAAAGIGDCGYRSTAIKLSLLIALYRIIPGARGLLETIKRTRKKYLYEKKYAQYHAQYSEVLSCLDKIGLPR